METSSPDMDPTEDQSNNNKKRHRHGVAGHILEAENTDLGQDVAPERELSSEEYNSLDKPWEEYIPLTGSSLDEDDLPWVGYIPFRGGPVGHLRRKLSNRFNISKPIAMSPLERDDGPLKFTMQQMNVLEAIAAGKSVFMTGSAGTGKSFVLNYIVRMLKRKLDPKSVFITASTGLAACNLNGTTLHSFAGIGLGQEKPDRLVGKVLGQKEARERWSRAKVLIIDEISMIDGELFDKLEYVARGVRNDARCFGGLQLVVTGDFFQLPPVNPPNPRKYFAFEAACWNRCFDLQVELKHIFRQSDGGFVKVLNEIRKGAHTPETLSRLKKCFRVLADDGSGIAPTRLYPLKVDVKEENAQELRALTGDVSIFYAQDEARTPLYRYMLGNMKTEKELHLRIGAQVMLVKNLNTPAGLVNGAKGVVIDFTSQWTPDKDNKELQTSAPKVSPTKQWPVVRFAKTTMTIGPEKETVEDGGVEVASRIQVPLILAWALSVHKCQGMTLDKVETDLSKAFEYGMVYVALSRVKSLDGLQLIGFDPGKIKVHSNVSLFYEHLAKQSC